MDSLLGKRIAEAYDVMPHDPRSPLVARAYHAFRRETRAQFDEIVGRHGVGVSWSHSNPYPDSKSMIRDVRDHKRITVFLGGTPPPDHPLAILVSINSPLDRTYNDVFRVVHDVFGHAANNASFSAKGEDAAWSAHSRMYSPLARLAMTTETRGQNCWVNYGPHGDANRANPSATVYAEQKAGILPRFAFLES